MRDESLNVPANNDFSRRGFVMTSLAAGFALSVQPVTTQTIATGTKGLEAGKVKIPVSDGEVRAYRALPDKGGPFPVILVVHEIFGVHEHIKDICRRLAKLRYLAVAPELYARQGDVSKIINYREILSKVVSKVPDKQVMSDLDATVAWAKGAGKGDVVKLGITGFSWESICIMSRSTTMRRILSILAFVACVLITVVNADELGGPIQGEWRTTIGAVKLEQKGDVVTGSYGANGQFPLKGNVIGNILTFEYQEGQVKGTGRFVFDDLGNAFTGRFQIKNGRSGYWNGWRPDPKAPTDKSSTCAGLWLTDLGLMQLSQDGANVDGRHASQGISRIEGKLAGRRLEFHFHHFRDGQGWFDFAANGKSFAGAGNTDGFTNWFGWKGRLAPEFQRHVLLVPGKIVDGSTKSLLAYSVRAPEDYRPDSSRKWPTVLILHGSNMNSKSYVGTIATAWPDIARDFILLGINGETSSDINDDPRFNYSYVNYVGRSTFKGFPGTDRESPALVSEAMAELKQVYPISHFLVGGHSQGGFLTYSLLMNFPESMAGAFPISCGVIFQCEPDAYNDETLRKEQRAVPLAIIHGKNDPAVGFSMGQYAATLFGESDWPAYRFFTDEAGGHMFARLPVGSAIRWLESHASNNPASLIDFAANRLEQKEYRDAIAALRRAQTLNLNDSQKRRAQELGRSIDAWADADVAKYLPLIRQAKDASWIDGFLAFRDEFEFTGSAHEVMAAFTELPAHHKKSALKAFEEARQLFQQGKQDEGYAKYREIVEKFYASPLYRSVKRWLDERK